MNRTMLATFLFAAATTLGAQEPPVPPAVPVRPAPAPRPARVTPPVRPAIPFEVSVDPLDSHNGWAQDIEDVTGNKLSFPLLADPERKIAEAFDMIHPNELATLTVRTVFVIAPDNTVKLQLTYPASTGRNWQEILRAIDSIQLTANHSVSTPSDWKQGDDVIISPAINDEDAKAKFGSFDKKKDYLRYTKQPA